MDNTNNKNFSPETEELLKISQKAWENQDIESAFNSLEKIKLKSGTEGLNENWLKELEIRMKWVAFPALPEREQLALLANYLLIPLNSKEFSLKKALRMKYLASPTNIWFESVPRILEAIIRNEEHFGSKPIILENNSKANPTIGNWIRDYIKKYGMDKQNEIVIRKYLAESANVQNLSAEEKKKLEELLLIFESTKLFSIKQIVEEAQRIIQREKQKATQKPSSKRNLEDRLNQQVPQSQVIQQQVSDQQQIARDKILKEKQLEYQAKQSQKEADTSLLSRKYPEQNNFNPNQPQYFQPQNQPQQPIPQQPFNPEAPERNQFKQSKVEQPVQSPQKEIPNGQNVNFRANLNKQDLDEQQKNPLSEKKAYKSPTQQNIKQVLKNHPQIINQSITARPIILMGRRVPPTLQNWLIDYRSQFGKIGNTEDERREFLFRSINAKSLSSEERRRLTSIIESHDKGTPLTIDENRGIILFN
jgi:hypothetical protein